MVNRDALIAYLLHQMPEPERLDFAERWFTDPELSDQLSIAEAETLDAYVRGELSREQRELVERYLLNSDEQRQKLDFTAALHGAIRTPRPRRRVAWFALSAAAALVILTGLVLWTVQQNRELRAQIAKIEQNAQPVSGGIYAASLVSGSLRGGGAASSIVLPKDARVLRLDLELGEGERSATYSATLSTAGHSVWQEGPLHAGTRSHAFFVTLWIPVDALVSGNYTLALEAGGNPVVYYSLTIVHPS